jgi:hypothetical protein
VGDDYPCAIVSVNPETQLWETEDDEGGFVTAVDFQETMSGFRAAWWVVAAKTGRFADLVAGTAAPLHEQDADHWWAIPVELELFFHLAWLDAVEPVPPG